MDKEEILAERDKLLKEIKTQEGRLLNARLALGAFDLEHFMDYREVTTLKGA